MAKPKKGIDEKLAKIAKEVLNIPTLEERKMDALDFHSVGVWQIKEALEAAYNLGATIRKESTSRDTP